MAGERNEKKKLRSGVRAVCGVSIGVLVLKGGACFYLRMYGEKSRGLGIRQGHEKGEGERPSFVLGGAWAAQQQRGGGWGRLCRV